MQLQNINKNQRIKRVATLFKEIGLEDKVNERPSKLSGGQQQKVAFARSLLLNPKFIIADEPTGNLDQKSGTQLMDLIRNFNKKYGITILMVTHNPEQVSYATRVVKMVDGKVFSDLTDKDEIEKIKNDA